MAWGTDINYEWLVLFFVSNFQVREPLKENSNHIKVENCVPSGEKRKENQQTKANKKGDTSNCEDVHCLKKQKVTCEKDNFKDKPRQNEGYSVVFKPYSLHILLQKYIYCNERCLTFEMLLCFSIY